MSNIEMRSHQLMLPVQEWGCCCAVINSFFSSVTMWHPLQAAGQNQTVPFLALSPEMELHLLLVLKVPHYSQYSVAVIVFISVWVCLSVSHHGKMLFWRHVLLYELHIFANTDIDWQTFRLYVCLNRFLSAKLKFLLTSQALILASPPHPPNYCYWCCIGLH